MWNRNTKIVPVEHIVDLEQIMHINDVEHNCLGTNYYICFNGTKISIKKCITNYELNKFDGIKNKLMCLSWSTWANIFEKNIILIKPK